MKYFLALFFICTGSFAFAQRIQNGNYSTIGYISSDGKVQDGNYRTIGYIASDGKVQDGNYRTIGYIGFDGKIQDGNYRTIGYIEDSKVQDGNYRTIGYIDNGKLQDGNYRTVAYYDGVKSRWAAAAYFFFFFQGVGLTQKDPSAFTSFFQIGTLRFNSSINSSQAAKHSLRCLPRTTAVTATSLGNTFPMR